MVLFRSAVAPLAILAASSASLVDALPSPVRLSGAVPSVVNPDGTVNEAALQSNIASTFAKLEARQYDAQAAADVKTQVVSSSPEKRRLAKKCNTGPAKVSLDNTVGGGQNVAIAGSVGTPAQPATFTFDTGSYDMIVQSSSANGGLAFDPSKSTTYSSDGQVTQFNFVSGSYRGKVSADAFSVGGLSVPKQVFGLVESKGDSPGVSGTLGLGFAPQSNLRQPNFIDNLIAAGQLAENKFGLYIAPKGQSGSEVVLGGEDTSRYTGKLQTLENKATQIGYWGLTLSNIWFNGKFVRNNLSTPMTLIDSGAATSYLPKVLAKALHENIPGAVLDPKYATSLGFAGKTYSVDRWSVPCDAVGTFGFQFNSFRPVNTMPKYGIPAEDLKLGAWEEGGNMCATSVFGVDIEFLGQSAGILGVPLLRNTYTVFNYGSTDAAPTISFGKLA
ncbi:uncharacterized protein RHOBADRAFT_52203 [Rhodotorula graminis WP1]|uniref:Peptidase A1 domain-containing protein n=1 Tax=Rhodotorula graminis (strain WP1) TaxID=578459 RepID=A0A194S6I8_RHOGW|nr:uncharacterized protein RHOBADRAFT_52203 [Rhodotorula graminis WP1]KPV76159.1 hypothetical protein RHOBADRAFT_52203 [Rhodotorula graminis WP1]